MPLPSTPQDPYKLERELAQLLAKTATYYQKEHGIELLFAVGFTFKKAKPNSEAAEYTTNVNIVGNLYPQVTQIFKAFINRLF